MGFGGYELGGDSALIDGVVDEIAASFETIMVSLNLVRLHRAYNAAIVWPLVGGDD